MTPGTIQASPTPASVCDKKWVVVRRQGVGGDPARHQAIIPHVFHDPGINEAAHYSSDMVSARHAKRRGESARAVRPGDRPHELEVTLLPASPRADDAGGTRRAPAARPGRADLPTAGVATLEARRAPPVRGGAMGMGNGRRGYPAHSVLPPPLYRGVADFLPTWSWVKYKYSRLISAFRVYKAV